MGKVRWVQSRDNGMAFRLTKMIVKGGGFLFPYKRDRFFWASLKSSDVLLYSSTTLALKCTAGLARKPYGFPYGPRAAGQQ